MTDSDPLRGGSIWRVVLITGCSSGIGLATARRLAAAGHVVYATARRSESLAEIERVAGGTAAGALLARRLDVTDAESIAACVSEIDGAHGRIDVLVNNAGYGQFGAVEDLSDQEARRQFDVNVIGVIRLTRAVLPVMRRQGRGRIINVSSVAAHAAMPFLGAYSASKAALSNLSAVLRLELRPFGIEVVRVEPGAIATRFAENAEVAVGPAVADPASPYAPGYAVMRAGWLARMSADALPPETVARTIERAVRARKPKARYRVGATARWVPRLKAVVPDRVFEAFLARTFGLHKVGRSHAGDSPET